MHPINRHAVVKGWERAVSLTATIREEMRWDLMNRKRESLSHCTDILHLTRRTNWLWDPIIYRTANVISNAFYTFLQRVVYVIDVSASINLIAESMIDRHPIKVCDMKVSRKCHAWVDRLLLFLLSRIYELYSLFLLFTDYSGRLSSSFIKIRIREKPLS